MKCGVLFVCLSVSVSVSVWEGGDCWLREGRSREVMGGYGRLREVTEEENGGKWRNGRKKV